MKTEYKTIDDYIATFSPDVQEILQAVRTTVQQAAPEATEAISYQMPTFKLEGNLVHFAAYKNHIGLYPTPQGVEAFREELSRYKGAKGSVQFPLDQPIPYDLIRRIVLFRVAATKDERGFPKGIGNPARRALEHAGYTRLEQLDGVDEKALAALHGVGPKALAVLRVALAERGLSFGGHADGAG